MGWYRGRFVFQLSSPEGMGVFVLWKVMVTYDVF
jgi:hypothetical protein